MAGVFRSCSRFAASCCSLPAPTSRTCSWLGRAAPAGQQPCLPPPGPTPHQIIAQALTESILLAIAGGIAGLVVAFGAARLLLALAFHSAHFLPINAAPSLVVLAFAFVLALT